MDLRLILIIFLGLAALFSFLGAVSKRGYTQLAFIGIIFFLCFLIGYIFFHPLVGIISLVFALILFGIIYTDLKINTLKPGYMAVTVYFSGFIFSFCMIYQIVELCVGYPLF